MSVERVVPRHRALVLAGSVAAPIVLSAALGAMVPSQLVENTTAALLLVLVVVAAASTGLRAAGLLAAASAALAFDFFLTAPYRTLRIVDRGDVEFTVGLLLVGVAVTELALWGRRQQARASEQHGYLEGLLDAAGEVSRHAVEPAAALAFVERQLVTVLDLDAARFHRETSAGLPRLEPNGDLVHQGRTIDVDRGGLPTDTELSLPVRLGGRALGEFRLTAATHIARPTREQRRVAVLLADQAGLALSYETR
ncbi:MAG TPA: DUF4118 domain-containing protein [Microlunatus sp.]|nr:DUF4118 domain-containing protein [Microlunatus sp.]